MSFSPPVDLRMDALTAEQVAKVNEMISRNLAVDIKQDGPVTTLVHRSSGAWLQKQALTIYGAWRLASHMVKCMDEPKPARL